MIKEFVKRFEENKEWIREQFKNHPAAYKDVIAIVIKALEVDTCVGFSPDPGRVEEIDHGDYQGTLLYIIAEKGYQPSAYYYVFVDYGSCSGCDTLQAISEYSDDPPREDQKDEYMQLALHIVQGLKRISAY